MKNIIYKILMVIVLVIFVLVCGNKENYNENDDYFYNEE